MAFCVMRRAHDSIWGSDRVQSANALRIRGIAMSDELWPRVASRLASPHNGLHAKSSYADGLSRHDRRWLMGHLRLGCLWRSGNSVQSRWFSCRLRGLSFVDRLSVAKSGTVLTRPKRPRHPLNQFAKSIIDIRERRMRCMAFSRV